MKGTFHGLYGGGVRLLNNGGVKERGERKGEQWKRLN
jgi:hypothetical protein